MPNIITGYLIQFIPVLLGIIFFVLARSSNLTNGKIVIRTPDCLEKIQAANLTCNSSPPNFDAILYDRLLEDGLLDVSYTKSRIRQIAYQKLGLVSIDDLRYLSKRSENGRMAISAANNEFVRRLLSFETPSGILLFYLANDRLARVDFA